MTKEPDAISELSDELESLVEALKKVDNSELSPSFGAKDENIASLLEYLNRNPEAMDELFHKGEEAYGRDTIDYSRQKSDVVRLLFLLGLQKADRDLLQLLRSAAAMHVRQGI